MAKHKSDLIASSVPFVFGAVFGVIVGFYLVVSVQRPTIFFGGIIVSGLVGGALSARFGLRFWHALRHLRWWPP